MIGMVSDTLLLANVFERFWNLWTYELDPANFLSAPRLAWWTYLEILTNVDMLELEENGSGDICHVILNFQYT